MEVSVDRVERNNNLIHYIVGDSQILYDMRKVPVMSLFSEQVLDFFSKLSNSLLKDKRAKEYQDILSYAFWIRRANIEREKSRHINSENRIGRGISFHIAPSNVPINFAVSMTSALLAGNLCVIRVSNKTFAQIDIVCEHINYLLNNECKDMKRYICIVRYEHNDEINQMLSDMCDIRIVWGGNQTIEKIRKASLPPRAIEMAFADRYSLSVINADRYLKSDKDKLAKDFYTDTYYTDQNACSSPRVVVWLGDSQKIDKARNEFWSKLEKLVIDDYDMKQIFVIDKYDSFCNLASKYDGVTLVSDNNLVTRVEVDKLSPEIMNYKNGGGYFFEYIAHNLIEVVDMLEKTCQTISYYGINADELKKIVIEYGVRGVDRIVPIGKTMELQFVWDGYDMIETMSRIIWKI